MVTSIFSQQNIKITTEKTYQNQKLLKDRINNEMKSCRIK